MSTFTRMLPDERHEWGYVKYNWLNRKRDELIICGIAETYSEAAAKAELYRQTHVNGHFVGTE